MNEVVRDILAGNRERFREIVRVCNEDFQRIAFHFTGDWDEAKDVTQTTFIRVYCSLTRFNLKREFKPWIYRIHLNNCCSSSRRMKRKWNRQVTLEYAKDTPVVDSPSNQIDPAILRQVRSLSSRQRIAFVLVVMEGMEAREAAGVLGCAESTLRVHLSRARKNLRAKLHRIGISYE